MGIPIRYSYRSFPFSPRATKRSRILGILTNWSACLVYGLFWAGIVYALLSGLGISDDVSLPLSLVSLVGLFFVIKAIKKAENKKINEIATADLMALQHTDPQAFARYVSQLS